jgi:uncharacterized protein (TIGR03083 family)
MSPDPLRALRSECQRVSELVIGLAEELFAGSTRLPGWNVKELVGHMYRDVDRTNVALEQSAPQIADADSLSYWRRYDPAVDGADIADRAREVAAGYDSGQALASAWEEMWRRALGRAADAPRDRLVVTWGPTLTLEEFLRTRVLEIAVHRTDLNDALGLPADPTEDALTIVTEILLGLLDAPPPGTVDLPGVALLEIGTGRREPTAEERQVLGELTDRFPLLQ